MTFFFHDIYKGSKWLKPVSSEQTNLMCAVRCLLFGRKKVQQMFATHTRAGGQKFRIFVWRCRICRLLKTLHFRGNCVPASCLLACSESLSPSLARSLLILQVQGSNQWSWINIHFNQYTLLDKKNPQHNETYSLKSNENSFFSLVIWECLDGVLDSHDYFVALPRSRVIVFLGATKILLGTKQNIIATSNDSCKLKPIFRKR